MNTHKQYVKFTGTLYIVKSKTQTGDDPIIQLIKCHKSPYHQYVKYKYIVHRKE